MYDLLDAAHNAHSALMTAKEKLRAVYPNGRDYYPQPQGNLNIALQQFDAMEQALEVVQRELSDLCVAIFDGGFKR